jgi:glycosyltransferase involved in cell wall biosynthesis
MDVTIALEARYWVTPDGAGWSAGGMALPFWRRYLEVFDRVRIIARAVPAPEPQAKWEPVTDSRVVLCPMPNYQGPWQYLRRWWAFHGAMRANAPAEGAVILRVPSQVCNCLEDHLLRRRHPYGLEVVGDPYDVCAPGVVDHPLRPFFRWWFPRRLRLQCKRACGVAYVTREALQKRYPATHLQIGASDADLSADALVSADKLTHTWYSSGGLSPTDIKTDALSCTREGPFRIVMVGSLAQMYKGPDVLIQALVMCLERGLDVRAAIVGGGRYLQSMRELASRLGLAARVEFMGTVPSGAPIREILDGADLFVLPSRTEGLPRALIEAMARGLPCIATRVGGVPELLEPEDMVAPDNAGELADRICATLGDPERRAAMARRNRTVALEYREEPLRARRVAYYRRLREVTEQWSREKEGKGASASFA